MNKKLDWSYLQVFKAVAEAGSLNAAAKGMGLSQPTLGRRITALEREIGSALFEFNSGKRTLTPTGVKLISIVTDMGMTANTVADLCQNKVEGASVVRIACGPWLGRYLARNISLISMDLPNIEFDIQSDYRFTDISRGEVDIALRNRRPNEGRIIRRLIGRYHYAVYGRVDYIKTEPRCLTKERFEYCNWVTLSGAGRDLPSMQWLTMYLKKTPRYRFSQSVQILDAVKGGDVLGVMPCYVADLEEDLQRACEPFIPNSDGLWLLVAEDLRHTSTVGQVVNSLIKFFNYKKKEFIIKSNKL